MTFADNENRKDSTVLQNSTEAPAVTKVSYTHMSYLRCRACGHILGHQDNAQNAQFLQFSL